MLGLVINAAAIERRTRVVVDGRAPGHRPKETGAVEVARIGIARSPVRQAEARIVGRAGIRPLIGAQGIILLMLEAEEQVVVVLARRTKAGGHTNMLARGVTFGRNAVARVGLVAGEVFAQDDVDDAGHRLRPIHRRGAVEQDFDALDGIKRNRVDVDERGLTARSKPIGRHAPAIDQDQCRLGAHAAQRDTPSAGRKRSDGVLVEAAGIASRGPLQQLGDRGRTRTLDLLTGDDLDRRRRLAVDALDARAGDLDALGLLGLGLGRGAARRAFLRPAGGGKEPPEHGTEGNSNDPFRMHSQSPWSRFN